MKWKGKGRLVRLLKIGGQVNRKEGDLKWLTASGTGVVIRAGLLSGRGDRLRSVAVLSGGVIRRFVLA